MADTNKQLKNKQDWTLYYLEKNITKLDYTEFTKILNEIDFQNDNNNYVIPTDHSTSTPSKIKYSSNVEEAAYMIKFFLRCIIIWRFMI
ncbi:unnamed protein product [Cunninghamella echinulata]